MNEILHININEVPQKHKNEHDGYEYFKRELVAKGQGQCTIALYEIPPGKSAYPYHYHVKNEESFYILSGTGLLKTPNDEKEVKAGDFLFFPANENGAHKLTNISTDENLTYLDFDTFNDLEVSFYPDSQKIGIWGKDINKLYQMGKDVDYYEGE